MLVDQEAAAGAEQQHHDQAVQGEADPPPSAGLLVVGVTHGSAVVLATPRRGAGAHEVVLRRVTKGHTNPASCATGFAVPHVILTSTMSAGSEPGIRPDGFS
ncbi:hypothetical protein JCM9957A_59740 [Kineosporia succinea]